jgi:hypothetical protein
MVQFPNLNEAFCNLKALIHMPSKSEEVMEIEMMDSYVK